MSEERPQDARNASFRTVHEGPMTEVILMHAALAEAGLQPFIADANIKTIDPFITGLNPFGVRLQVPEHEVEDARRLIDELEERRARARELGDEDEDDDDGFVWEEGYGADADDEDDDEDDRLATRDDHPVPGAESEDGDEHGDEHEGAPVSAERIGAGIIDPDTDAQRLARRTRWTAIATVAIPLLAPLLLYYFVRYYLVSRASEHRPHGDTVTVAAAVAALIASIGLIVGIVGSFGGY